MQGGGDPSTSSLGMEKMKDCGPLSTGVLWVEHGPVPQLRCLPECQQLVQCPSVFFKTLHKSCVGKWPGHFSSLALNKCLSTSSVR